MGEFTHLTIFRSQYTYIDDDFEPSFATGQPTSQEMIGPSLPPHLQKKPQKSSSDDSEDRTKSTTPSPPPQKAVTGPQLPPHLLATQESTLKRKRDDSPSSSTDETSPVYGPAPPTKHSSFTKHSLSKRPSPPPPPADSDSDSDIGPSLSSMMTPAESEEYDRQQAIKRLSHPSPPPTTAQPKLQRDAWMLAPPSSSDWMHGSSAAKLKARTFQQSKSGTVGQGKAVDHTVWTETPLERAQRLEDEALGRKPRKVGGGDSGGGGEEEEEEEEKRERDRRIKEYNAQTRGPSLMEKYAKTKKVEEGEEDVSKRGFDWQKDMAGGGTLGFKERSAMINKAKDLDSKYSGGNYL